MKKPNKPAKIIAADVKFISLCFEGKTGIKGLYKAKGKDMSVEVLHQSKDLGKGRLLTVLYAPNAFDDEVEWSDEQGVQTMIDSFAKNGKGIDVNHDETLVDAYLVESFTIQEGDKRFDEFDGDMTGGWGGILQINDEVYKEKYANGDWSGTSIGGDSVVVEGVSPMKKSKHDSSIKKLVARMLSAFSKKEVKGAGLSGLHLSIDLARDGEIDFSGNPRRDSFHISLNGDLI